MTIKKFQLRLTSSYSDEKNTIDQLSVEEYKNQQWQTLDLNILSPGFSLLINGLFSCQHLYMRTNCAEKNVVLASCTGELTIYCAHLWEISQYDIGFSVQVKSGELTDDDITYIKERMTHCPVSSNLDVKIEINNSLTFSSF